MNHSLAGIEWHETNPILNNLIASWAELTLSPLSPGLEADVVKITQGEKHFVLKVWNKRSKPDVLRQYRLLEALHLQGVRVSEPIAYGRSETGDGVLLTRYHGTTVTKVSPRIFKKIAAVLADIHRLPPDGLEGMVLDRYDFVVYFFPGIEAFPAMKEELIRLVALADMKMDRIIHGDFNLCNILEENGQYTVIDWTNGQLGDPRYDLSWACLLLRIYLSESKSLTFLYKYQDEMPVATGELEIFEAIACLRWLLLDRIAGVPKHADTMKKVRKIVRDNRFLNESVLL
ncbi:phosphotransferase family protein [Paenibacillus sp. GCM10027628]|uniref:phosphotransferase family protein n=1 Tax=Paenibacillus sp. GCM10027628 TaxID=3273413 RepID=UPI00362B6C2A